MTVRVERVVPPAPATVELADSAPPVAQEPAAPEPAAIPSARAAGAGSPDARAAFAHASEAEMARILDFYEVRWEYEPDTFPILWNLDGEVVESFAPDFYLPELDVYLEMTTLRQRLVRKKNRKLRRLKELYPDVRIKLFYARDFRALMLKYGRLAVVDGLSGTLGQVPSHRLVAADAPVATTNGPESAAHEPDHAGDPISPPAESAPTVDPGDIALAARPVHRSRSARRRRAAAARRSESALTSVDLAAAGHSVFLDGPAVHRAVSADR